MLTGRRWVRSAPVTRALAIAAAAVVAVVLFVLLRPSGDDTAPTAPAPATTTAATEAEPPEVEPVETTTEETTGEETTTEEDEGRIEVVVRGGEPLGGIVRATVEQGEDVTLVVRSDVADHVHLHGYDLIADVAPGQPGRIEFEATAAGRFEVELEDRGVPIAEISVR